MNEYPLKCHTFALVKRLQVRVKAAARQNSSKLDSALALHFTCPRKQVAMASEGCGSAEFEQARFCIRLALHLHSQT